MDPHQGRHRLLLAFVVLVACVSYAAHVDMYFVKDDFNIVLFVDEHGDGEFDFDEWWGQFMWPTERTWDDLWRPIPALTWAAEYLVFGADPTALHLGQIFLHALCCVLLYWCVNRLTSFKNPLAGFFAGLMFAVYPLHPEAILWLTQRTVLMGLAFSLAAIIQFDVWLHRRRRRHLIWAFLFVILGTLSREHALPLPAVFCVQALLMGPRRRFVERFRQCLVVSGIYVAFVAGYFACRFAIWGRLTGPYSGYETNALYAEANGVFERFWNETIRACVVPCNAHWFDRPVMADGGLTWLQLASGALAAFAALAVLRTLRSLFKRDGSFGFLAVVLTFTLVSWIPVWEVFWINKYLLNSRSGYHLVALLVAWMAVGLVDPWSKAKTARRASWRIVFPTVLTLGYAVMLQVNLRSWTGGDAQVRGLQSALVREADTHGRDGLQVVFNVPSEFYGCTTIDNYLPTMMGRPFVQDPVPAHPFVVTARRVRWLPSALDPDQAPSRWRRKNRPLHFYRVTADPVGVAPMFGAPETAQGDHPPVPVFPVDGEFAFVIDGGAVVHPAIPGVPYPSGVDAAYVSPFTGETLGADDEQGMAARVGPSLVVSFDARADLSRFVLHLDTPGRLIPIPVVVGTNAARDQDGRVHVRLSNIAVQGVPLWPPLPGAFPGVLPVMWRVEARDVEGTAVGLSETRRLVIIDARTWR